MDTSDLGHGMATERVDIEAAHNVSNGTVAKASWIDARTATLMLEPRRSYEVLKPWRPMILVVVFFLSLVSLFPPEIIMSSRVVGRPQQFVQRNIPRLISGVPSSDLRYALIQVGRISPVNISCDVEYKPDQSCDVIIDLECPHMANAIFHGIVDCLAYEYGGTKQALRLYKNPCFSNVYYTRQHLYSALMPSEMRFCSGTYVEETAASRGASISAPSSKSNRSDIIVLKPNRTNVQQSAISLLNDTHSRFGTNSSNTILLVQRDGKMRKFSSESLNLLQVKLEKLARDYGRQFDIYYGTEDVEDTILKFHSADIVLLFHGAAAANMLFANRETHIIEISTYRDDSRFWRSNTGPVKQVRPDINTCTYWIPLSQVSPDLNLSAVDESTNADAYIKNNFQTVSLRNSDVDNLFEILRLILQKRSVDNLATS